MRPSLLVAAALTFLSFLGSSPHASLAIAATNVVTFPPGWNMVGGPAGTRLTGASTVLYTRQFRDGSYESVGASGGLTGGLGYWAYFPNGGSATLPDGGPCVVAVPIGAGEWVMVGNPWPSAAATVRGIERSYTYDPGTGYVSSVRLQPGHAAFTYSSVATTVAIVVDGCPTESSVPPSPPVPPDG